MKILWVTNILIGDAGQLFFKKPSTGLWMDRELRYFEAEPETEFFVLTTGDVERPRKASSNGVTYYLLPDRIPYEYKAGKERNTAILGRVIKEISPDVITLWGNETDLALDILSCRQHIPVVLCSQGIAAAIQRFFRAGLTAKEILPYISIADILTHSSVYDRERSFRKAAKKEAYIIRKVHAVIGENQWSRDYYRSMDPNVKFFTAPVQIRPEFFETEWTENETEPYTLMTNAANYPLKGLHVLLKALVEVRKTYPDVKLIIPGNFNAFDRSFSTALRRSGYMRYIVHLIRKYHLEKNIEAPGYLTPARMVRELKRAQVFIMNSSIENHANALKEAMILGVPSIGSMVGGVGEYLKDGENGTLVRFGEAEVLAGRIIDLLENREKAIRLAKQGQKDLRALHDGPKIHRQMVEAYREIVEGEK